MNERHDARSEVRCNVCMSAMVRLDSEKKWVCRSNSAHTEPFRDDLGIITDRKRRPAGQAASAPAAPPAESEPAPLTAENIQRLRDQVPTEKRGDFDRAVEAAQKTREETISRARSDRDETIGAAQEREEKATLAAGAAHDKKVRTALGVALGVPEVVAPKAKGGKKRK